MTDDISLLCSKMSVGHDGVLLVVSWSYFSTYQKSCHVLLLTLMVHFEVESTQLVGNQDGQAVDRLAHICNAGGDVDSYRMGGGKHYRPSRVASNLVKVTGEK